MGPVSRPIKRCDACKFYYKVDDATGECRRYPPSILLAEGHTRDDADFYRSPLVYDIGWCGEWQAIESTT